MGYLKKYLDSHDKREMVEVIDQYRQEFLPPVVPITLLRHHLNRHPVPEWVKQQTYLNPFPGSSCCETTFNSETEPYDSLG